MNLTITLPQSTIGNQYDITSYRHPDYDKWLVKWTKFRDAWEGGEDFIEKYTKTYSKREDPAEFTARKEASYCPAISKGCVMRIKNAISQRFGEITRKNGPKSYQDACTGDKWGIDKLGSSMDSFVSQEILPELLALGKVGVYVDAPTLPTNFSLRDKIGKRPYIYTFKAEDIVAWVPDETSEPNQFSVLLLREHYLSVDPINALPIGWRSRFRLLKKVANGVSVSFYDEAGTQIDQYGLKMDTNYIINIPNIPFVVFALNQSLLTDIAAYQVALLNLGSSDMAYALKSNFPFYTEQYDPRSEEGPMKTGVVPSSSSFVDPAAPTLTKAQPYSETAQKEIKVGVTAGRRYPVETDRPDFIHPSPEPLMASMKKQDQLKQEIQEILSLSLSNITAGSIDLAVQASKQGLESGLHNIGLELEHGERQIAAIWCLYEGSKEQITITYPKTYSLKTDEERRKEAKETNELKTAIPSATFQKEIGKQVALILLSGKVDAETIEKINKEIDTASTMTSDADDIATDLENGLVGDETASLARGYPPGEVEKAKKDHADRIARIQKAQMSEGALKNPGSRGVGDMSMDDDESSNEKKAAITTGDGLKDKSKQRGDGK